MWADLLAQVALELFHLLVEVAFEKKMWDHGQMRILGLGVRLLGLEGMERKSFVHLVVRKDVNCEVLTCWRKSPSSCSICRCSSFSPACLSRRRSPSRCCILV